MGCIGIHGQNSSDIQPIDTLLHSSLYIHRTLSAVTEDGAVTRPSKGPCAAAKRGYCLLPPPPFAQCCT